MNFILFLLGIIILIALDFFRVYFIMPFPGSQHSETIEIAYFLHQYIWFLRIAVGLFTSFYLIQVMKGNHALWAKILSSLPIIIYCFVIYLTNYKMMADTMFLQPTIIEFTSLQESPYTDDELLIGTEINGEAKAYPLEFVGYHHQIQDSIGGEPVMITYCTVCRTARIWSPKVLGKAEQFRLVGMDHFNAMFEDKTSGSWWRQGTGEAVVGPLKGTTLTEFTVFQLSKSIWKKRFPNAVVMIADPTFQQQYDNMKGYAKGNNRSSLTGTSKESWKDKSWVIGVQVQSITKAYDWIKTQKAHFIQDSIHGLPIIVTISSDNNSFHVWSRRINSIELNLQPSDNDGFYDAGTQTTWDNTGRCIDGILLGKRLDNIPAYQEFWHSWRTFHPDTKTYGKTE